MSWQWRLNMLVPSVLKGFELHWFYCDAVRVHCCCHCHAIRFSVLGTTFRPLLLPLLRSPLLPFAPHRSHVDRAIFDCFHAGVTIGAHEGGETALKFGVPCRSHSWTWGWRRP